MKTRRCFPEVIAQLRRRAEPRRPTILLRARGGRLVSFLFIYEPLTRSFPGERRAHPAGTQRAATRILPPVTQMRIVSGDTEVVLKRRSNGWQLGEIQDRAADRRGGPHPADGGRTASPPDHIDGSEIGDDKDLVNTACANPKRRIEFEGPRKLHALSRQGWRE